MQGLPEDEIFGGKLLEHIDTSLTNEEYMNICIKRAKKFFHSECGNNEAKKQALGDNKSTKIESSVVLRENPEVKNQWVSGNIKALLPLSRELLTPEPCKGNALQFQYRRGKIEKLFEKRIFGVLTKHQVGHIPNVNICFNDTDEAGENAFGMDMYAYKQLSSDGTLVVDVERELYKQNVMDDYKVAPEDLTD